VVNNVLAPAKFTKVKPTSGQPAHTKKRARSRSHAPRTRHLNKG
jgi:hypothetical protein